MNIAYFLFVKFGIFFSTVKCLLSLKGCSHFQGMEVGPHPENTVGKKKIQLIQKNTVFLYIEIISKVIIFVLFHSYWIASKIYS